MASGNVPPLPSPGPMRATRRCASTRVRSRTGSGGPVFELVGRPSPGGGTWAWARSDLDAATVATARRDLSALLGQGGDPGVVLVYLGPERFVDLRGLRLLVGTADWLRSRGGALAVVAPPRCVHRMVRLEQLDTELPLLTTARLAARWARAHRPGAS